MDTVNLTIGSVQNLFFELETRPRTVQFKPHEPSRTGPIFYWDVDFQSKLHMAYNINEPLYCSDINNS